MAVEHSYSQFSPTLEELRAAPTRLLPRPTARPLPRRTARTRSWTALRLGVDSLMLAIGIVAALSVAPAAGLAAAEARLVVGLAPLSIAFFAACGLYRPEFRIRLVDGLGRVVAATALAAGTVITTTALLAPQLAPAPVVAQSWLLATACVIGGRVFANWAERRSRATHLVAKPTLIVGAGHIGALLERRLTAEPELGLRPVGYIDADPPPADDVPLRRAPILGRPDELGWILDQTGAEHVVLGFTRGPDSELFPLVRECESRGVGVSLVPRLFECVNVHDALEHIGGLPLFAHEPPDPRSVEFAVKHVLDRVLAAALLVVLAPLMLAIAAAVKLSSPGPALFRQRRIGRDGRDFEMLKFRSMRMPDPAADAKPRPLRAVGTAPGGVEGVDRRTRVGAFLRRTSLDELPQLIMVLRGEMSLVGPRPERPEFVEMFGREVRRYDDRHRVKSGITGWAQIHGLRGKTSVSDRVELDNHYIVNWSLSLDLKILFLTFGALFAGDRED